VELLIVIHHPRSPIRPARELLAEVAGEYDRMMGRASTRFHYELPQTLILLLDWPCIDLNWPHWSADPPEDGLLATVGLPLIYAPVDGRPDTLRPARLKRLIAAEGTGASADLGWCGGAFAGVLAKADGQVLLVTNYLGEVPLYRAAGDDGLVVWSNKAAAAAMLSGIELKLNTVAAREFVLLAHPLEGRTLYQGVEAEPPATCVMIDASGVRRQPYLKLPEAYFAHRVPPEEIVRRTVAGMEPVITMLRESPSDIRLHLSGGMDSRAIAAICMHHGYRPKAVTHSAPNDEVPSARRLARRIGMPYQVIAGEGDDFFSNVSTCLWQSDGMSSLKYLSGRYDMAMIRDEKYLPLEGLGGECGRGYYFGESEATDRLGRGVVSKFLDKTLGKRAALWPSPGAVESLREDLSAIIDRYQNAGLGPCAATTCFYINQRVRRWGATRRNTGWQWIIDPLLLPCWTYYAMSADPTDQINDRLLVAIIEHAAPSIADVPTSNDFAAEARRQRVAGNRIVRTSMKIYDRLRRTPPPSVQTRTLTNHRAELIGHIRRASSLMPQFLTAEDASGWLAGQPWNYDQTELFWHTATLAMWCNQFLGQAPAIGAAAPEESISS